MLYTPLAPACLGCRSLWLRNAAVAHPGGETSLRRALPGPAAGRAAVQPCAAGPAGALPACAYQPAPRSPSPVRPSQRPRAPACALQARPCERSCAARRGVRTSAVQQTEGSSSVQLSTPCTAGRGLVPGALPASCTSCCRAASWGVSWAMVCLACTARPIRRLERVVSCHLQAHCPPARLPSWLQPAACPALPPQQGLEAAAFVPGAAPAQQEHLSRAVCPAGHDSLQQAAHRVSAEHAPAPPGRVACAGAP